MQSELFDLSSVTILKPILFGNSLGSYLSVLLFVATVFVVAKGISWILKTQAKKLTKLTKNEFDDLVIDVIHSSITYFLVLFALYVGLKSLSLPASVFSVSNKVLFVLLTVKIAFEFEKLVAVLIRDYLDPLARRQKGLMQSFVPTILRFSKFIIWALAFLLILSNIGYNVASLLAGLGIGGLAIALAAQEALGNFFGSIALITDAPFKIGDFITVDGNSGTVKEIGMRSTRIQTLDKSILSIPNKKMAEAKIENISRRNAMKVEQVLSVTYSTSLNNLKRLLETVKGIIQKDPATENETVRVNFVDFGDSALELKVFYYITETDSYAHMLDVRQRINLKIKRAFERIGVEMAFPSRSVYLENAKNFSKTGGRTKAGR